MTGMAARYVRCELVNWREKAEEGELERLLKLQLRV